MSGNPIYSSAVGALFEGNRVAEDEACSPIALNRMRDELGGSDEGLIDLFVPSSPTGLLLKWIAIIPLHLDMITGGLCLDTRAVVYYYAKT